MKKTQLYAIRPDFNQVTIRIGTKQEIMKFLLNNPTPLRMILCPYLKDESEHRGAWTQIFNAHYKAGHDEQKATELADNEFMYTYKVKPLNVI